MNDIVAIMRAADYAARKHTRQKRKGEEAALKEELFGGGLLEVDRRGQGFNYVVKRRLPDDSRPYFVVVRHKRKKPYALGQAFAAARAGRPEPDSALVPMCTIAAFLM
jgi:hypothetical protein